ncbi:MAG: hypothetical protein D6690_08640 [Nitrospirae bacterium]|nr:MAG: hypothetical protein D6690_08640 [Nitrospirota bacterium]
MTEPVALVTLESRIIYAHEIHRLRRTYGFSALDAPTGAALARSGLAPRRFRSDLPEPLQRRIIERTVRECPACRQNPEGSYLTNLWHAFLTVLALRTTTPTLGSSHRRKPHPRYESMCDTAFRLRVHRICCEVWPLFCLAQFLELSPIEVLELSAEDCSAILRLLQIGSDDREPHREPMRMISRHTR